MFNGNFLNMNIWREIYSKRNAVPWDGTKRKRNEIHEFYENARSWPYKANLPLCIWLSCLRHLARRFWNHTCKISSYLFYWFSFFFLKEKEAYYRKNILLWRYLWRGVRICKALGKIFLHLFQKRTYGLLPYSVNTKPVEIELYWHFAIGRWNNERSNNIVDSYVSRYGAYRSAS